MYFGFSNLCLYEVPPGSFDEENIASLIRLICSWFLNKGFKSKFDTNKSVGRGSLGFHFYVLNNFLSCHFFRQLLFLALFQNHH